MERKDKNSIFHISTDHIFISVIWILAILFFLILVYPILFVIISSFSGGMNYMTWYLLPSRLSVDGYKAIISYPNFFVGLKNSIFYVVVGTIVSLVVTVLCAYPLSRKEFKGGKIISLLCIFTMYFSGGLIPTYLWIRDLGLMNSPLAIILPGSLNVYYMIVMRTYFNTQIPNEIREAASIDGCGDFRFLLRIVLPLSKPILAVIALYCIVDNWNGWFSCFIYLTDREKYPLAIFLREILIMNQSGQALEANLSGSMATEMAQRTEMLKYGLAVVSTVPMMLIYPFIQKYFVKGVMIGAVKE